MKTFILIFLTTIITTIITNAQQQQPVRCGTTEFIDRMKTLDPTLEQRINDVEVRIEQWMTDHPRFDMKSIISIPVVVHVVYNNPAQNIPDSQIYSQIEVLNEDFKRLNADAANTPSYFQPFASDVPVEFCLASRDPQGNWTSGIIREPSAVTEFDGNIEKCPSLGGDTAWDTRSYLNIWVCNLPPNYLGITPGPAFGSADDGVTVKFSAFGRRGNLLPHYNLGRTATHEVGHWLNLKHIWGDGSPTCCTCTDLCFDTPWQDVPTYGCPSGAQISCNNGPNGNMYQDYMDYTDDACMNLFTTAQKSRMVACLFAVRSQLLNSNGCIVNRIENIPDIHDLSIFPNPSDHEFTIDLSLQKAGTVSITIFDVMGSVIHHEIIGECSGGKFPVNTSDIPAGLYNLQLQASGQTLNRMVAIIH